MAAIIRGPVWREAECGVDPSPERKSRCDMSLDRSLKGGNALIRHRDVQTRTRRFAKPQAESSRSLVMRAPSEYISARAHAVDASGIRKVFDLAAKMKDPINLSIGLPDFDVPEIAKTAAIDAIRAGHNRYTQTQGIEPLRTRLRADLSKEIGRDVGDVLITSGVSGGLFLAILATINPGDEALFLDPYFVMYKHLLTLAGGKPAGVDSYPDFRFHPERVERA